jgi:adenylate kinase family enzyme
MLPGVVLAAPYGHDEDYAALSRLGAFVIECHVSPETAVQRFRSRGPDPIRKDLTEAVVRRQVETYHYRGGTLILDTDRLTHEECLSKALTALSS